MEQSTDTEPLANSRLRLIPSTKTIGGMGAGWHSFDETADLGKIAIRTKLAAVFLLRLSRQAFTDR